MNNYKLVIQYDGTKYCGWQIQENAITVQEKITDAINTILSEEVNLIGSGRTDSGVHALGQSANFRCEKNIDIYRFKHSLNSILPFDISVISMEKVDEDFHARFDAKKRSYVYLITQFKSPFFLNYAYYYHDKINVERLNHFSRNLFGEHNFTSFSRKISDTENKVCTIHSAHWKETRGVIVFYVEADRYLHGMVRTIVGTVLKAVKISAGNNYISDLLDARNREEAGEAVPAKGLFLFKVKY